MFSTSRALYSFSWYVTSERYFTHSLTHSLNGMFECSFVKRTRLFVLKHTNWRAPKVCSNRRWLRQLLSSSGTCLVLYDLFCTVVWFIALPSFCELRIIYEFESAILKSSLLLVFYYLKCWRVENSLQLFALIWTGRNRRWLRLSLWIYRSTWTSELEFLTLTYLITSVYQL